MTVQVSVIIATRDRPELLDRAIRAILAQDFDDALEVLVVFDQSDERELTYDLPPGRDLRVLSNQRTPGLAGARNTGILAARGELIAFCDDDDEWLPTKLKAQVGMLLEHPRAMIASTGITIRTEDGDHERIGPEVVELPTFLRVRLPEIHPSTFLIRRDDLLGALGLVDEDIPFSYGEDYDLLLRAGRLGYTINVREPLVNIYWNRPSFFSERWAGIAAGLRYILEKTPEFDTQLKGKARVEGQIAFASAASGDRRQAMQWARKSISHDPAQARAYAAIAVCFKVISARRMVNLVQARGKGL